MGSVEVTQRNAPSWMPHAERAKTREEIVGRLGNDVDHPAQAGDVEFLVDRLVPFDNLRQRRQVPRAVLVAPAGLRHEPLRLAPDGAAPKGRGPFADRAGLQHVVAEELELVPEALLQLRQLGIVLVLQEVHLQPDERAAFTVDREPGVVHAVLIEVREDLIRVQRSRRREQHLVQVRGQADAGRIRHHVERAALLVLERLHPAQEEQCARGRTAHRAGRRDDARLGDADLLDVGMDRGPPHRRRRRASCQGCWSRTVP